MAHHITAIIIADPFQAEAARALDLVAVPLSPPFTLFHIDRYYTAYWQAVRGATEQLDVPSELPEDFPRDGIVRHGTEDELDTVGLGAHRSSPSYLHRYVALCAGLGG